MESKTIEIGDATVEVRETDDGFEVVEETGLAPEDVSEYWYKLTDHNDKVVYATEEDIEDVCLSHSFDNRFGVERNGTFLSRDFSTYEHEWGGRNFTTVNMEIVDASEVPFDDVSDQYDE